LTSQPLQEDLAGLLAARTGHFRLESGYHGELWLDLDALFVRPDVTQRLAAQLARRLAAHGIEAVCGPLVGGAFLAQVVAAELGGDFYYAERLGTTQGDPMYAARYRVPGGLQPLLCGKRVGVVDDVINAGSAVRGTVADLRACGARLLAVGALLVLGDAGPAFAESEGLPLESIARWPNTIWVPEHCPLCAAGVPLEGAPRPGQRSAESQAGPAPEEPGG
jgi:orotate phosphoribosyltransferase